MTLQERVAGRFDQLPGRRDAGATEECSVCGDPLRNCDPTPTDDGPAHPDCVRAVVAMGRELKRRHRGDRRD